LSFAKKYIGKEIYISFIDKNNDIYLYPHDEMLNIIVKKISDKTWIDKGVWSSPNLTKVNKILLESYKL